MDPHDTTSRRSPRVRRRDSTGRAVWLVALAVASALVAPAIVERLASAEPAQRLEVTIPVEGLH